MPKHGDLRIWWIPQVPGMSFYANVESLMEGARLLNTLAEYDRFQYEHKIKPDYCNAGGLQEYRPDLVQDKGESPWCDWYDDETGDNLEEFLEERGISI